MRLSDAILLGDSLKERHPMFFFAITQSSGNQCGCAIAGAFMAVGVNSRKDVGLSTTLLEAMQRYWPWVTGDTIDDISDWFFKVADGEMTIEQLADRVRSIEPSPPIHAATESQPTHVTNEGGDPGDEHVEPAQKVGR